MVYAGLPAYWDRTFAARPVGASSTHGTSMALIVPITEDIALVFPVPA